jgi:hypothetical protein
LAPVRIAHGSPGIAYRDECCDRPKRELSMNCYSTFRPTTFAFGLSIAAFLSLPIPIQAQGELIGRRGGTLTSMPPGGLLGGLNLGGQSIQNGLGQIVSRMAQDGVRGQQLASAIQNLQAANRLAEAARLANTAQSPLSNLAGAVTQPILPSTLNLPPGVQNSLLQGLDASGTATRHGMGWLVSDAAHQGIHGQQLADVIHQLKPYKERGVLMFPQNGSPQIFQQPQRPFGGEGGREFEGGRGFGGEGGRGFGGGFKGHGKGKGR